MKRLLLKYFLLPLIISVSTLCSYNFTVSSFNCGGISDHYDYIRAVCMHKLTRERYNAEPTEMAQLKMIQDVALKISFSSDIKELHEANEEWDSKNYSEIFEKLTSHPGEENSLNKPWHDKSEAIVTSYKERPVTIFDEEVIKLLEEQIKSITNEDLISIESSPSNLNNWLDLTRGIMAKRIFRDELKYDLIALQEADYLDHLSLPNKYAAEFAKTDHSINGVAWNTEKFELVETIGNILDRGFAVKLRDIETKETIAIASAHLTGCNPFKTEIDPSTKNIDSTKGDEELQEIIKTLDRVEADIKIIAMDSNVTATHPRLSFLKNSGYLIDYTNSLEPTCTNPWQVLNTRIDWIAIKSSSKNTTIRNIPVLGVGLNNPQSNFSDHKPIAARVQNKP